MSSATSNRWVYRLQHWGWQVVKYAVLITFVVIFVLPFIWVWSSALKTSKEITRDPFALPEVPQWQNLSRAWVVGHFNQYMGNTILYAASIVAGVCGLSCLAGYSLAVIRPPGQNLVFVLFLLGMMVPFQSTMIPLYYLARDLRILATRWAMILPGTAMGLSFGVFLMRSFFLGLPSELRDAAKIDGCTESGVFWKVMLPLAVPGLTSLAVFQFMWTWNAFLLPLVLVQREALRPLALGVMFYFGRYTSDRGMIAAGMTLSSLPIILVYFLLQRQFIRGITAGALKG